MDLFIYHPGTGTVLPLSDELYLCDSAKIDADIREDMEYGVMDVSAIHHKGIRIDNQNLGWFLYGHMALWPIVPRKGLE